MIDERKLLPIGSVIKLKDEEKKIMITGFYVISKKDQNNIYDYIGCLFPEGIFSSQRNIIFNHEQISDVCFRGFVDEEEIKFKDKLNKAVMMLEKEE